jgi:hypothetical protein
MMHDDPTSVTNLTSLQDVFLKSCQPASLLQSFCTSTAITVLLLSCCCQQQRRQPPICGRLCSNTCKIILYCRSVGGASVQCSKNVPNDSFKIEIDTFWSRDLSLKVRNLIEFLSPSQTIYFHENKGTRPNAREVWYCLLDSLQSKCERNLKKLPTTLFM